MLNNDIRLPVSRSCGPEVGAHVQAVSARTGTPSAIPKKRLHCVSRHVNNRHSGNTLPQLHIGAGCCFVSAGSVYVRVVGRPLWCVTCVVRERVKRKVRRRAKASTCFAM